jgi:hypothetical protein
MKAVYMISIDKLMSNNLYPNLVIGKTYNVREGIFLYAKFYFVDIYTISELEFLSGFKCLREKKIDDIIK